MSCGIEGKATGRVQPRPPADNRTVRSEMTPNHDRSPRLTWWGDATKEEKIAAYDSIWGNAGTYEVTGETVTIRPIISRVPNFMAGGYQKYQFRVDGDTLWLTGKSTDELFRFGEQVVPASPMPSETRTKLVRVR